MRDAKIRRFVLAGVLLLGTSLTGPRAADRGGAGQVSATFEVQ